MQHQGTQEKQEAQQGTQQSMQQSQQPFMQQPPKVITTKDHSYLKDQLSWELLAMKKCHDVAGHCTDQEIRQAIEKAGRMHQRHYEMLLKHLQTNNQAAMQALQQ
jgi:hypothetical protein